MSVTRLTSSLVRWKSKLANAIQRSLSSKMEESLSVLDFGAVADYNPTTKTGTDNTQAFRNAVAAAIAQNIRNVYAPGGPSAYMTTGEINLGGEGFTGGEGSRDVWRGITQGVHFFGDGPYSTIIAFNPPNTDAPCFSARGGWGTHSPRALSKLAIEPVNWADYNATSSGTGVLLQGCCFVPVTDVHIGRFHRGIHFWNKLQGTDDPTNTFTKGDFTEFNRITRVRVFNCDIDIDYQVSLGNNSFHGNSFTDCMCQINSYGGIGMRMWDDGSRNAIRPSSLPYEYIANVYNNKHEINWFGSDARTCYLMHIDKAQGHGCNGDMTVEAAVTLRAIGQYWYQSFGSLHSISAINTVVDGDTDTATRPVAFMWMNSAYPQVNFDGTDPLLTSGLTPRQYDLNNSGNTGMELLNIRGANTGAIWSIQNGAALGWILGRRAQADSRKGTRSVWQFSYNGEVIKSVSAANVGLQNSTGAGFGMLGDTLLRPYAASTISLGSPTYPFTRLRTTDWTVDTNGIVPVQDGIKNIGSSSLRVGTVFAATGTINTSDARLKTEVRPFTSEEILAAKALSEEIGMYQWVASIESKGDNAREHCGLTVQRAIEVMQQHNLDPFNYGFICHDVWDEVVEVSDETGDVISSTPAGDRYSFRFDQLSLFISRGIEARMSELESRM
ncbi:tail spike protein [Klebsiella phage vB_Kpn_K13PH07C1L]|uniref:Tail spike protein n=1 Tax=Klebsiella phage vB_Kpn_K13PH07C1L TaxID=3071649 RepID=A0AAV1MET7_9CAUD|nr:tail spike protein [Klebsiella phage vB_Kpn_K13PH07C1L]CAK6604040.1 tail spike protein [Klebsiella phage vB_Kpn_K13PH07C1S]